ncbi:hypothetical protein ZOSMA_234G00270 [Zostera marina]|uniref:F-box domain-containing protein n=1 Tax=Zostera marina TaxID=29655 RepID=A0A0K9PKA8_ZOSMR|nr:hypothetical protein ZOSMA_234G00270 [Zostera marina]
MLKPQTLPKVPNPFTISSPNYTLAAISFLIFFSTHSTLAYLLAGLFLLTLTTVLSDALFFFFSCSKPESFRLLAMAEKLQIIQLETGKDRISSLPEQAMNKILGSLPIRDAISTSFLSKGWRYKWRSMSDLIFHRDSFSSSKEWEPSSFTRIYLSKVHRILFLHRGDIQKFKFHSSGSEVINSEVDLWLDYLVVASVQQLVLTFTKEYLVHSAAFRFDKLITLDLKFCKITLPASFDGFKLLTTPH